MANIDSTIELKTENKEGIKDGDCESPEESKLIAEENAEKSITAAADVLPEVAVIEQSAAPNESEKDFKIEPLVVPEVSVNKQISATNESEKDSSKHKPLVLPDVAVNEQSAPPVELEKDSSKNKPPGSDHIRLEGNTYVYTDPTTKSESVWDTETSKWIPRSENKPEFDGKTYSYKDPQSGDYYKWNVEKNEWEKFEVYGFDGENHTYTDPKDNTVYIWDKEKNAWFPKVDEDFLAIYQMNYGFIPNEPQKSEESVKEPEKGIKRKVEEPPKWFQMDDDHNTKVYVSNLPLDITEQEFVDLMQKCGLIMKDVNTMKWKIKLYADTSEENKGQIKGDGLCTYIKKESVELAVNILDGYEFRGKKIKVERAKFEMKGDFNPALKPKKKRKREKEKEKKLQQKLFDWRPDKLRGERPKNERTVIIKNLFDPKTFDERMELIIEYTQDLREECEKCGVVKKLILHDKHKEGIAQVTYSDAEEADICIKLLNNRWFGQRKITAETWDGKTKYKVVETEEESKARLDNWSKFLENEDKQLETKS